MTVDPDPLTEAIAALVRHEAACPDCDRLLPDAECEERARLKTVWRRVKFRQGLREDARRITAARQAGQDYGSADHSSAAATEGEGPCPVMT